MSNVVLGAITLYAGAWSFRMGAETAADDMDLLARPENRVDVFELLIQNGRLDPEEMSTDRQNTDSDETASE